MINKHRRSVPKKDFSVKTIVTPTFREVLIVNYPGLLKNEAYMKLASVLLFSTHIEKDTGNVILPAGVLADCEAKRLEYEKNHYNGEVFLKRFQAEVMSPETFTWSDWSYADGRARSVQVIWNDKVVSGLEKERQTICEKSEKVSLVTGKKYGARERKKEYEERVREAESSIIPVSQPLLDYLKGRPKHLYTLNYYENVGEAMEAIEKISTDAVKQHYNYNVMLDIQRQPKPIFRAVENGNTDRIFETGMGYLSLKSPIRKVLTKNWYEYDLKHAQLAICAALWKVDYVQKFLNGGDIWEELFNWFEIDYGLRITDPFLYDDIKKSLKIALYALTYGMSKQHLEGLLYGDPLLTQHCRDPFETFISNPIIAAMYAARQLRIREIEKAGAGITCFGKVIPVIRLGKHKTNIPSILCEQAQAVELKLLLPVLDLAKTTSEFQIVLWCHDGFVVAYRDKRRIPIWESRITEAVKQEALRLGIATALVKG